MAAIKFFIDDYERDALKKLSKQCGITMSQIIVRAVIEFLKNNNVPISNASKMRIHDIEIKHLMRQNYYIKNAIKRIFRQVIWQIQLHGDYNHEAIIKVIDKELEGFDALDSDIQGFYASEKKMLENFKNRKNLDDFVLKIKTKPMRLIET